MPAAAALARLVLALSLLGAGPAAARTGPHRTRPPSERHADEAALAALRARLQAQRHGLAAQGQAAQARAEQSRARLQAARRQAALDAARAAALSAATVQAASRVQETEQDAARAGDRTRSLTSEQQAARLTLQRDADALAPMLPVFARLSLYPAETLLAAPGAPDDAITGLMVLRELSAELEQRAQAVRAQQARLDTLGHALGIEQVRLARLQQQQATQQASVAARAQAAQAVQRASRAAADQAARDTAAAAAQAATLGDAVARITAAEHAAQARFQQQAAAAEAARQPVVAREARESAATLALPAGPGLQAGGAAGSAPVVGPLVQRFGDRTETGASSGISYAPPPFATVTAPCAGRIDFAGPFRSYGRMLILDCGHDYRFVLAGLDRLDVAVGQVAARGAAVGRMPNWEQATAAPAGGRPSLYVQLRHGDATIDPTRFLQHPR